MLERILDDRRVLFKPLVDVDRPFVAVLVEIPAVFIKECAAGGKKLEARG